MAVETSSRDLQRVAVVDVDMPFWSMVAFMLKWAIAAVPAFIILGAVATFLAFVFATVITGTLP